MILRVGKTILTGTLAVYFLMVAVNNITDYHTNFAFVQHVMRMDSIPIDSNVAWRAIYSTTLHHFTYWIIITWELLTGIICSIGTARLLKSIRSREEFESAERISGAGLWLGLILWIGPFITVAGEWFMMWESNSWNGELSAFRMFTLNAICLLFLYLPERPVSDLAKYDSGQGKSLE